ncbi:MAG: hypothetical protein ABIW38_00885 [Ferruginibacter sp.]
MNLHTTITESCCTGVLHTLHKKLSGGIKVFLMLFLFTGAASQVSAQFNNCADVSGPQAVCVGAPNQTYILTSCYADVTGDYSPVLTNFGTNATIVSFAQNSPTMATYVINPGTQPGNYEVSFSTTTNASIVISSGGNATAVAAKTTAVDKTPTPILGVVQPTCTVSTGTITVTSPTANQTFSLDGGPFATYPAGGYQGLTAGQHCVRAQSLAPTGCISTQACVTINAQPATPSAPTLAAVQPTCTVATGTVTITSATAGLTFSVNGAAFAAYPVGGFVNLAPGQYCVRAQNAAGCISAQTCITINAQPATPSAPTLAAVQPTCTVATGTVTITSATAGLTFSVNGAAAAAYPAGGYTNLAPGQYCITATNAAGCTSGQTCITINAQPATPTAPTLAAVQPTCTVATGTVTITSATAGLTFSVNGAAAAAYPVGGYTNLAPGQYCITATNAAGCTSGQTCITINAQPATPSAPTLAAVQPTCTVATGTVTITSATAGMTFSVNGAAFAAYPVGGFVNLAPGQYCVRAQNAAGCISTQTCITINAQPATPSAPILAVVQPSCTTVATGTVTITSATAGLTFSVNGGAAAAYPAGGYTNLAPGQYCITATNAAGCTSTQTCITVVARPNCVICSYTQGFYGNRNGLALLQSSGILNTPLIIGGTGPNTITITSADIVKLNSVLPGGRTPTALVAGTGACMISNTTCFDANYLTQQGRINNNLLSQTITLSLNVRLGTLLNNIPIQSGCLITSRGSYRIDESVATYLACKGTATVSGLLALANGALGGSLTPGQNSGGCIVPSYSAINSAVDAINNAFDECQTYTGYGTCTTSPSVPQLPAQISGNNVTVNTFPNPYNDNVTFNIESNISGKGVLEVYNLTGQKLKTVFEGNITAGRVQSVRFNIPSQNRSTLIYRLTVGETTTTGKVLYAN